MDYEIELVEVQEQPAAVVRGHVAPQGIGEFVGGAFGEVMSAVRGAPAGMPFARYTMTDDGFDIEAGFPVAAPIEATGRVVPTTLPGGLTATLMHAGPYQELGAAYGALEAWIAANGCVEVGAPWESYLDGPEVAEPRTVVTWPVRREE